MLNSTTVNDYYSAEDSHSFQQQKQETDTDFYEECENRMVDENIAYLDQLRTESEYTKANNENIHSRAVTDEQVGATELDTEIFIEIVRQYPCIWNNKLNVYRDQVKKKVAWGKTQTVFSDYSDKF